jgi:hypothetical protein
VLVKTSKTSLSAANARPPSTPPIAAWMIPPRIEPRTTIANVLHQKPLTSRKERPSARLPFTPSVSRAGTATVHEM